MPPNRPNRPANMIFSDWRLLVIDLLLDVTFNDAVL